jgi:uncharacterized radical SAM protein YgiQ
MPNARDIFSYRQYWAKRLTPVPFLPMSRVEMDVLGWDSCDIILITGDAYVDLPSFGMAIVGRVLEAQGFRVGVIAQPDWRSAEAFKALGRPNLFFGVTAGNMDSMVNRYTAERKIRSDDAYTPGGEADRRPDRSVIVYAQRAREAYPEVPIVLGGIEASLRRAAHYDYWSDTVRRSVLLDSKADLLVFGNGERQIVEIAHRLAAKEPIASITGVRGTAFVRNRHPDDWAEIDATHIEAPGAGARTTDAPRERTVVRLPSYERVRDDPVLYGHASRALHLETNPFNARALVQRHGERDVWINPPPLPLTTKELDAVYELPYQRVPHPAYAGAKIPAYEMIRFSIAIQRGCFGGCTFCSITEHEGRVIQSRSEESVLREIETVRDRTPGFTGVISDLGGPTANMYRLHCREKEIEAACRKLSCVFPDVCPNLVTSHTHLIGLYRRARHVAGVKKVLIGSGVRYDLAITSPEYVKELVTHHVGGYLKIAPEHLRDGPLSKMMKPGLASYYRFKELFEKYTKEAGKEQYLIPYFIAAHPGTTDEDMLELALWLKHNRFRADQVQAFLPTPMTLAAAMYHSGKNPLHKVTRTSEDVVVPKGLKQRRLHKAFLRYHDPDNWPQLRAALRQMGRADLIGPGKHQLIPAYQPAGREPARAVRSGAFTTQHVRARTGAGRAGRPKKSRTSRPR